LIAQAGARTEIHTDACVGPHVARLDAQPLAQVSQQCCVAMHTVGDVVAKEYAVLAHRLGVKEAVERRDAFYMGKCQPQRARHV